MSDRCMRALPALLGVVWMGAAWAAAPTTSAGADTPKPAPAHAAAAKPGAPQTDDEKTMYALGVLLSGNLENFSLTDAEFTLVRSGFTDGFHHKADTSDAQSYAPKLQALVRTRVAAVSQKERQAGQTYLDKQAAAPGAHKTASGLVFISTSDGTGATPARGDQVKVNYEGKLIDGTVFDSSASHGQPATFPVGQVIPCWTEALQLMKVGGKARVICPADLAYGDRGAPPKIKPGSTLDFTVELLEVTPAAAAGAPTAPSAAGGAAPATPAK